MEDTRTVSLPQRHMLQFSISQLKSCPMTESPEEPKVLEKQSTRVSGIPVIPVEQSTADTTQGCAALQAGGQEVQRWLQLRVSPRGKKAPSGARDEPLG